MKVLSKSDVIERRINLEMANTCNPLSIELKAHGDGLIYWCSHWEYIEDLAKLKQVMKSEAGPLHSYDFHLPVQLLTRDGAYE